MMAPMGLHRKRPIELIRCHCVGLARGGGSLEPPACFAAQAGLCEQAPNMTMANLQPFLC